ncbi:hypothetical protein [Paenibacillus sp. BC26]|uniref:hypothetical protein n=1 Tax=Paenibacillus sp. BC26 TaxID=1881032 RepID=UPI0008F0183F|nr:hypothetical protein [Paenibacillus sp. BC26]SFS76782.1 hypothetical protein SAMN05428962_2741 [Paenibacillus sp. BC26]
MKESIIRISLILAMSMIFQSVCKAHEIMPQSDEPYRQCQLVEFSSPDSPIMHKAELFGTIGGFPRGKLLKIDGVIVDQNRYITSKIMLGDVIGDRTDEVFFYQYSTGSAGAMGLNVYSLYNKKWKSIFNDPSMTIGNDSERFSNEYIGNRRLRFYDKRTDLSGVLDMTGFHFSGDQLKMMRFQTDPISQYNIHYENIGCGIETIQWIFGYSHPHAVFSLHNYYRYKFDEHEFSLYETRVQDNEGGILARKVYF